MEQKNPQPYEARVLLNSVPLVLDLDGTLIHTDTFHEMLLRLLYKKPFVLLRLPLWFLRGRAFTKARLAEETDLTPRHLPYNPHILSFAKEEAKTGRPLILATGTPQKIAHSIASYLGIFQDVIGSDEHTNMTGPFKQKALLDRFGLHGFDYAGDSRIDAHIWKVSHKALIVRPKRGVLKLAQNLREAKHVSYFPREISRLWALCLALRPLFWLCNLLTLSWPLFIGLSLMTSGLLISGDLALLYKERAGSFKKSIFAEGHLHLSTAFLLVPLLTLPPLVLFPRLLFYLPFFVSADILTRTLPQTLRWTLLSALQVLGAYIFFIYH